MKNGFRDKDEELYAQAESWLSQIAAKDTPTRRFQCLCNQDKLPAPDRLKARGACAEVFEAFSYKCTAG